MALGGQASTTVNGEAWDYCNLGDISDHKCLCNQTWAYGGSTFHGCTTTPDHDGPWCYVDGECKGAIKTHKTGLYWDTCDIAGAMMSVQAQPHSQFSHGSASALLFSTGSPATQEAWAAPWEAALAAQVETMVGDAERQPPGPRVWAPEPLREWGAEKLPGR